MALCFINTNFTREIAVPSQTFCNVRYLSLIISFFWLLNFTWKQNEVVGVVWSHLYSLKNVKTPIEECYWLKVSLLHGSQFWNFTNRTKSRKSPHQNKKPLVHFIRKNIFERKWMQDIFFMIKWTSGFYFDVAKSYFVCSGEYPIELQEQGISGFWIMKS